MQLISELGLKVPDDWEISTLGTHTSKIGSGATPKGGSSVYVNDGVALVRSQNVYDHSFKSKGLAFIDETAAHALRGVTLHVNDVLINITGDSILRTTMIPSQVLPARVNQHVSIVRADDSTNPLFVQKWLSTPWMKGYMLGLSSGGTRKAITKAHLESLPIAIPPLSEQATIASTLGALDDKIESSQRSISKALEIIDTLSEAFGENLPSISLRGIANPVKKSINPASFGDSFVDHFSLPAFDEGGRPERASASTIRSSKLLVPSTSILISRLNPRIERIWWATPDPGIQALASTEFVVLSACNELELAAAWLAVRSLAFREELPQRVTGTSGSHQRVRPDDALSIEVPDFNKAPNQLKQTALTLLTKTSALRLEIERLAELRDALLPELMSGRIRVPEA